MPALPQPHYSAHQLCMPSGWIISRSTYFFRTLTAATVYPDSVHLVKTVCPGYTHMFIKWEADWKDCTALSIGHITSPHTSVWSDNSISGDFLTPEACVSTNMCSFHVFTRASDKLLMSLRVRLSWVFTVRFQVRLYTACSFNKHWHYNQAQEHDREDQVICSNTVAWHTRP